ncbi:MAG: Uma2 family endonuclease [Chloroflexi bacterium]|nr:Uma2 family endonuclease [Chloroflexota bacterium]
MTTTTTDRFTTADLDRLDLPEGWRAEIIDGALYVSKAPGWDHQGVIVRLLRLLGDWADAHSGAVNAGIGVIYADDDNVIPDVVWISAERLAQGLDAAGHLYELGPELVVEVVSPGTENARRDREAKLALYSRRDALEYWIVDPIEQTVHQYQRAGGGPLQLRGIVGPGEWLTSDLLEGFAVRVSELWP